jgi:2-methylcitrate dehydratase
VDTITQAIASYSVGLTRDDIPPAALHGMKRRLVDTMGCALGGLDGVPVTIARQVAATTRGEPSARVFFSGELTTVDTAAFANSLMVRYLDFNDTYMAREGGHPSDTIAGTLAMADAVGLAGGDALLAMVVAFETVCALAEAESLSAHGIDHSLHVAIGSAVGACKVMNLSEEQTAHAVAMATASNVSLKVSRDGQLSMWKSGSAANAAKGGVFCARLASMGMTGPGEVFMASGGLAGVLGEVPEIPQFGGRDQAFHTDRSSIKAFPAQYNAQAVIWAALALRDSLDGRTPDDIVVTSYGHAVRSSADPTKWIVHDRETADHSIPYLVAVALADGEVTPAQFTDERILDPEIQSLLPHISVREDASMTTAFPGALSAHIAASVDGQTFEALVPNAKGHELNPLTDAEIETKFRSLARGVMPAARVDAVLARLWAFEDEPSVTSWVESLRV